MPHGDSLTASESQAACARDGKRGHIRGAHERRAQEAGMDEGRVDLEALSKTKALGLLEDARRKQN